MKIGVALILITLTLVSCGRRGDPQAVAGTLFEPIPEELLTLDTTEETNPFFQDDDEEDTIIEDDE